MKLLVKSPVWDESGLGQSFVDYWKAAIDRHSQPDYVFVDSRMGPNRLHALCSPNLLLGGVPQLEKVRPMETRSLKV
jgi:hypothetical protein